MTFRGSLEDRIAIRELIESYADAVTRRDADAWAALWDEDARWLLPNLGAGFRLEGKRAIVPAWRKMMIDYHGPEHAPWTISFSSVLGGMDVDGDRATVRSWSFETFDDGKGRTIHLKGRYDDRLIRYDARWLFAERSWDLLPLDDFREMAV